MQNNSQFALQNAKVVSVQDFSLTKQAMIAPAWPWYCFCNMQVMYCGNSVGKNT
jgi:hypothetical protein